MDLPVSFPYQHQHLCIASSNFLPSSSESLCFQGVTGPDAGITYVSGQSRCRKATLENLSILIGKIHVRTQGWRLDVQRHVLSIAGSNIVQGNFHHSIPLTRFKHSSDLFPPHRNPFTLSALDLLDAHSSCLFRFRALVDGIGYCFDPGPSDVFLRSESPSYNHNNSLLSAVVTANTLVIRRQVHHHVHR